MTVRYLLLFVYVLTFILGVPTNILAFCIFCVKVQHKATAMDILLLNLTISDLLFLTFLPVKMKEAVDDMEWNIPYPLCEVSKFFFYSCIYTSTLFLTGVAIERYLAMAFPFQYKVWCRPRYAVIASILFWLVITIHMSVISIAFGILPVNGTTDTSSTTTSLDHQSTCSVYQHNQMLIIIGVRFEMFLVLFLVPFLICCFCHINFIRILCQMPTISRERRLRAVGLAVVTLLTFIICFAPYNISHVVGFVYVRSEHWRDVALISTTLNTCLDPMIFYFSSSTIRCAIRVCLQGLMEKLHILSHTLTQCCPPLVPARPNICSQTNHGSQNLER